MVKKEKIYPIIVDESENIVYISDPETYEVVYLNQAMRETLDLAPKENYYGMLCYELFQGRHTPCPFCTNHCISSDGFYTWKHYNEKLSKYFSLKDKLIEVDGKNYRMEICVDITESEILNRNLEKQLSIEETLVRCIHTLSENQDLDMAIHSLLQIIGDFYQADRSYIFEYNYQDKEVSNTYEWCREHVASQMKNSQNIPLEVLEHWKTNFKQDGIFYVQSLSDICAEELPEYEILKTQGVESFLVAPISGEESGTEEEELRLVGFIGVDNPRRGTEYVKLIQSVAYFVSNDIYKRRMFLRLKEISRLDMLTGLGNRNYYLEAVDLLKKEELKSLGVVFIDINGLKYANDHFGHSYGDDMIKSVAQGIQRIFKEHAYRIGGDEFIVLYLNGTKAEFDKKLDALKEYAENECICDFSMGVNFGEGDINIEEQIGYSDNMMYVEKQVYYGAIIAGERSRHKVLARQLVREIEAGGFEIFLQPKINLETREMVGAEALMRRRGEDGEMLMPDRFISLYEAEGVIQYLDCYGFEEVCKFLKRWIESDGNPVPISVNFSRISLMGRNVVSKLAAIRDKYEVPPELLVIEVTESVSQMEPKALRSLKEDFAQYHFVVSLDDFGYQYSNLAILANMDFVELKLDKSLVDDLKTNEKARVVVENSIEMCRRLDAVVSTAEGIESEEQLSILKEFHCSVGQGYFFSEPLPAEVFLKKFGKYHIF